MGTLWGCLWKSLGVRCPFGEVGWSPEGRCLHGDMWGVPGGKMSLGGGGLGSRFGEGDIPLGTRGPWGCDVPAGDGVLWVRHLCGLGGGRDGGFGGGQSCSELGRGYLRVTGVMHAELSPSR